MSKPQILMEVDTRLPQPTPIPLPPPIRRTLATVISHQLRVKFLECLALLVRVLPLMLGVQALADWSFNLSYPIRFFLALLDLAVVCYILFWFGWRPFRNRLNTDTAALLVERKIPEFRSALVTVVELCEAKHGATQGSLHLLKELIADVSDKVSSIAVAKVVVDSARLRRWMNLGVVSLVIIIGLAILGGARTLPLVQRILLFNVPLPTRTIVVPISKGLSIPMGSDIELQARAEGEIPKTGHAYLIFESGEKQDLSLTPKPDAPGEFAVQMGNVQQSFRYRITLNDGSTEEFHVTVLIPPATASLKIVQEYPAYTGTPVDEMNPGNLELFQGSVVKFELVATKPLKSAGIALEGLNKVQSLTVAADGKSAKGELSVPKEGLTGISFPLVDQEGVSSVNDTVYRVSLLSDTPPAIELVIPTSNKLSVLLRSIPRIGVTAKDDFRLQKLVLKYDVARGEGEESVVRSAEIPLPLPEGGAAAKVAYPWQLAKIQPPLEIGSVVTYWIEAQDNNNVTGPGIGESVKKTFVIVSEDQKRAELQEALGKRADDVDGIYNSQKEVNEQLDSVIRKQP